MDRIARDAKEYLRKHQTRPLRVEEPPAPGLGLVVVVPARNEPDLSRTLESLWRCEAPPLGVEVLVVVNDCLADAQALRDRSAMTLASVREPWFRDGFTLHLLDHRALAPRDAGVGLARKLGMDEAVARLSMAGNPDGVIACVDADCTVSVDYLRSVAGAFSVERPPFAATVHFEHSTAECEPAHALAIARYELFLRYYRQGLAFAGCPYAVHTVGSCIAVRRAAYQRQGGMNRRQAGEDFYFLHKIARAGSVAEITDATVFPSARVSDRVPFGTGRAMGWQVEHPGMGWPVLAAECFLQLAMVVGSLDQLRTLALERWLGGLPDAVSAFLERRGIARRVREARDHTATAASFRKRMLNWFDAFEAMKLLRHLSGEASSRVPVESAAADLLALAHRNVPIGTDAHALLTVYRRMDRARERLGPRAKRE